MATPTDAPPKTSNGPFIGAAILMLLLMGGLIYWKLSGDDERPQAAAPPASVAEAGPTVDAIIPPPPPTTPTAEVDAGTDAGAKRVISGGGTGCQTCGKCQGVEAPGFAAALRSRAGQAQRCYEKALAQQDQLQGRLSVRLCVGVGGGVCGASISKDSLGSSLVSQCVLNIYRATTFPSPKNGCVEAEVPLNFVPQKQ